MSEGDCSRCLQRHSPEAHPVISKSGQQAPSVRAERSEAGQFSHMNRFARGPASGSIPNSDTAIVACSHDPASIRTELRPVNLGLAFASLGEELAGAQIIDARRTAASRQDALAVGTEFRCPKPTPNVQSELHCLSAARVPDPRRSVNRRRDDLLPVRAEPCAGDLVLMVEPRRDQLTEADIPYVSIVSRGDDNAVAFRTEIGKENAR